MEIPIGYAQVNLHFTGDAVPTGAQVTLGLDRTGYPPGPDDAAELVGAALGAGQVNEQLSDDCNITLITVKYGPTATGPSGSFSYSGTGEGGTGGVPNAAWLVAKSTAFGGRAGRGRMYLPGVPQAACDDAGVIAPTPLGDMQTAIDTFAAYLILNDLVPVLLHGEESPIETPTPIEAFVVQSRAATQRRRLRR